MSSILRRSNKLTDNQLEFLVPALVKALTDENVRAAWDDAVEACWPVKDAWEAKRLLSDAEMAFAETKLQPLVETVREAAPDFALFFGVYLADWLQFFLLQAVGIDLPKKLEPEQYEHLMPNDPLTQEKDGSIKGHEAATMRCLQQLRDYHRQEQPLKKVGRHKGSKRPKAPDRGGIDPAKALRACEMVQHGKHWREIATTLLPEIDVYVDSDIAYQRVRRLIERGRILSESPTH